MNAIVFEHVPIAELPAAWRKKLSAIASNQVRVCIEEEEQQEEGVQSAAFETSDPAFGIWRDRPDISDVPTHVRELRESRYGRDGSRKAA